MISEFLAIHLKNRTHLTLVRRLKPTIFIFELIVTVLIFGNFSRPAFSHVSQRRATTGSIRNERSLYQIISHRTQSTQHPLFQGLFCNLSRNLCTNRAHTLKAACRSHLHHKRNRMSEHITGSIPEPLLRRLLQILIRVQSIQQILVIIAQHTLLRYIKHSTCIRCITKTHSVKRRILHRSISHTSPESRLLFLNTIVKFSYRLIQIIIRCIIFCKLLISNSSSLVARHRSHTKLIVTHRRPQLPLTLISFRLHLIAHSNKPLTLLLQWHLLLRSLCQLISHPHLIKVMHSFKVVIIYTHRSIELTTLLNNILSACSHSLHLRQLLILTSRLSLLHQTLAMLLR